MRCKHSMVWGCRAEDVHAIIEEAPLMWLHSLCLLSSLHKGQTSISAASSSSTSSTTEGQSARWHEQMRHIQISQRAMCTLTCTASK